MTVSRYFDLALKTAIEEAVNLEVTKIRFFCDVCLEDNEYGLEDFKEHLNHTHLNDCVVMKTTTSAFNTIQCITAKKVDVTNELYCNILKKAKFEADVAKTFLQTITNCLIDRTNAYNKKGLLQPQKILSYKCYFCKISYEHLHPFIEHLTSMHASPNLEDRIQISTESVEECFIHVVASYSTSYSFKDLPITTTETHQRILCKCLLCDNTFASFGSTYKIHRQSKVHCFGCNEIFHCFELNKHKGQCEQYLQKCYPKTCRCSKLISYEKELIAHQKRCPKELLATFFTCPVCQFKATTINFLQHHQKYSHTVRSDEFIFSNEILRPESTLSTETNTNTRTCCTTPNLETQITQMIIHKQGASPVSSNSDSSSEVSHCPNKEPHLVKIEPNATGDETINLQFEMPVIVPGSVKSLETKIADSLKGHEHEQGTMNQHDHLHHCVFGSCNFVGDELALWKHSLLEHNVYNHRDLMDDHVKQLQVNDSIKPCVFDFCDFEGNELALKKHNVDKHSDNNLVCDYTGDIQCQNESDPDREQIKKYESCVVCGKMFFDTQSLVKHHKEKHWIVSKTKYCIVCDKAFKNAMLLKAHQISSHRVTSTLRRCVAKSVQNPGLRLNASSSTDTILEGHQVGKECNLCLTAHLYPGDNLGNKVCMLCCQQFKSKLCWTTHNIYQKTLLCTICNKILYKACMAEQHPAYCPETSIVVYECENCGFKEDTISAINKHCKKCFSNDKCRRVFMAHQVLVPLESYSADPRNDHTYAANPALSPTKKQNTQTRTEKTTTKEVNEHRVKTKLDIAQNTDCHYYDDVEEDTFVFDNIEDRRKLLDRSNGQPDISLKNIFLQKLQSNTVYSETHCISRNMKENARDNCPNLEHMEISEVEINTTKYKIKTEAEASENVMIEFEIPMMDETKCEINISSKEKTVFAEMDTQTPIIKCEKRDAEMNDFNQIHPKIPKLEIDVNKCNKVHPEIPKLEIDTIKCEITHAEMNVDNNIFNEIPSEIPTIEMDMIKSEKNDSE